MIIQMAVISTDLYVLCADGSVWLKATGVEWVQVDTDIVVFNKSDYIT